MDLSLIYYVFNAYCSIALLCILVSVSHEMKNRMNIFIMALCISVIIVLISDCFTYALDGAKDPAIFILCKVANTTYFLASHFSLLVGLLYIVYRMDFKIKKSYYYIFLVPTFLMFILDLVNLSTGWLFYFNETNNYVRGNLYFIHLIFTGLYAGSSFIAMFIKLFTCHDKSTRRMLYLIILFFLLPVVGIVLQNIFVWIPFTWPFTSLAIVIMYIVFHNQTEKLDYLTKVFSKGVFDKYALKLDYTKNDICLIILDIDNFKRINDTYGHKEGDMLLRYTAENLKKYFKTNAIVGRIGGDEFAVLLTKIKSKEQAIADLDAFLNNEHNAMVDVVSIKFTCSAGVCFADETVLSYDELFEKADMALYKRKEMGRDGYTIYSASEASFKSIKPFLLLVDTSELKRTIFASYLSSKYTMIEAENLDDAKHYLRVYKNRISGIVLDINSAIDGDNLYKSISEAHVKYNIPLLTISDEDLRKVLSKFDINLYLNKPYNLEDVINALNNKIVVSIKNDNK